MDPFYKEQGNIGHIGNIGKLEKERLQHKKEKQTSDNQISILLLKNRPGKRMGSTVLNFNRLNYSLSRD